MGTLSATCWQGTHMGFTWQSTAEPREGKDRRQIERAAPERVAPSPHHNVPEGFTPGSPQTVSRVLDGSRLPHMPKCLYSGFCVFSSQTRSTAPGPLQGPLHFEVSGRPFVERLHLRPQAPSPAPPGFCGRPPRASQVGSKPHSLLASCAPRVLPARLTERTSELSPCARGCSPFPLQPLFPLPCSSSSSRTQGPSPSPSPLCSSASPTSTHAQAHRRAHTRTGTYTCPHIRVQGIHTARLSFTPACKHVCT